MEEKILKSEHYNAKRILVVSLIGSLALFIILLFTICDFEGGKWCYDAYLSGGNYWVENFSSAEEAFFYGAESIELTVCIGIVSVILSLVFYWLIKSYELIVTDKRVHGRAAFGRRVDLPIDSISAIGTMWFKGVVVSTSSGRVAFLLIKNRDEVHKCVGDLLIERQTKAAAIPTTTIKQEIPQSNADELKKYKELLDMGVITQEEFDSKKKHLLGL